MQEWLNRDRLLVGERRLRKWQSFLREGQEGLFSVRHDKSDSDFRFDIRWNDLYLVKHETKDIYAIFGEHAAYFYDLNREIFKAMKSYWDRNIPGVRLAKEQVEIMSAVFDCYFKTREAVQTGEHEDDGLPLFGGIYDEEQERLEDIAVTREMNHISNLQSGLLWPTALIYNGLWI